MPNTAKRTGIGTYWKASDRLRHEQKAPGPSVRALYISAENGVMRARPARRASPGKRLCAQDYTVSSIVSTTRLCSLKNIMRWISLLWEISVECRLSDRIQFFWMSQIFGCWESIELIE